MGRFDLTMISEVVTLPQRSPPARALQKGAPCSGCEEGTKSVRGSCSGPQTHMAAPESYRSRESLEPSTKLCEP